jgi:hypothetical protein
MRLHRYRGRENGVMVIGTKSELKALGQSLLSFAEAAPELSPQDWPPQIVQFVTDSSVNSLVSFHLETASGQKPKSNLP